MLLDPLEEQLDLPAALVERADGGRRQGELVGQEHQRLARFGVLEADAPQMLRVIAAGGLTVQGDGLVADDAGRAVCRRRVDAVSIHIGLRTGDEESASSVKSIQALEVDIAAIHDVDGAGLRDQSIERMDVMQLAIRDVDEAWGRHAACHPRCG